VKHPDAVGILLMGEKTKKSGAQGPGQDFIIVIILFSRVG